MPMAEGDYTLITQLLYNLLENAVKYSSVKNEKIEIVFGYEKSLKGIENVYYISDNGIGFEVKYLEKIFGVFQRLQQHKNIEGTGVGLAIVKRIIEKHRGKIWAESEPGKGSTFYFSFS